MRRRTNDRDAIIVFILTIIIPLLFWWPLIVPYAVIIMILRAFWNILKKVYNVDEKTEKDDTHISHTEETGNWKTNYYTSKPKTVIYEDDKNMIKGIEAEEKIVRILRRIFSLGNVAHDLYFRDDELVTTQVDVVAVNETGIYVIESKAFSGVIKGKENYKIWTQLFANKRYNKFSNPINQNNRHIEDIKKNLVCFNLPNDVFKSYIVFADNCKLDIELDKNSNVKVIKQKELFYTVLEDVRSREKLIPTKVVEEIARRMVAHSRVDEKVKEAHIERRKNNIIYR